MIHEPRPIDKSDKLTSDPTDSFIAYVDNIVKSNPIDSTDNDTRSGTLYVGPNKTIVAEITNFSSALGPEYAEILDDIYTIAIRDGAGNSNNSLTVGTLGIAIETADGQQIDYSDLTTEQIDALILGFSVKHRLNILGQ
jgi:hypothetical protein